jgi:outer membrane immunogenic protein
MGDVSILRTGVAYEARESNASYASLRALCFRRWIDNVMRKFAFGAALVALTAVTPVFAADMAAPLGVAAGPPHFSWTGCFIGGHVGGVISEDRTVGLSGIPVYFSSAGFVGGGQIGCDYQFASNWVAGVEGRAAWSSLTNTHAASVENLNTGIRQPSQFTLGNDFLASTTARLGYSFADRWLLFVRGGAAWTDEKIDDAYNHLGVTPVDPSATLTRTGWTVGTGVDWAFAPHWSATFEYNYYDFGTHGAILFDASHNVNVTVYSLKDTIHAVTAGVNYHF